MTTVMMFTLVALGFVGGGVGFGYGRKALQFLDRALDRRIALWLAHSDAGDGPYVHLPRGPMPAEKHAAPARRAPATRVAGPVGLDSLAAAR
jgi:hypothetical protein